MDVKKAAQHSNALPRNAAELPAAPGHDPDHQNAERPPSESQLPESQTPAPQPSERWTVDGIEDSPGGPLARLEREDGTTFDLPLRLLPGDVREGDVLAVQDGPDGVTVRVLVAETMERRDAAQTRLDALNSAASDPQAELHEEDGEITV